MGLRTSKNIEVYGRTPSDRLRGLNRDRVCVKALRGGSVSLARFAFQACSIDHSDISPFRINYLRHA